MRPHLALPLQLLLRLLLLLQKLIQAACVFSSCVWMKNSADDKCSRRVSSIWV